ncbi:MFS transporter [Siminovitchia terrae]|uniref:MFS transporter n=1 Tax=Siminovitchia terrae TaxID=1914933 RepID=UPI001B284274|nr:aromatic acid/H+ symport family MFS transporter [Siminovitchia terrae]GIN90489.1 MFS transporter [Siminovitchia terrae]
MNTIDANQLYDKSKFNRFHFKLLFWCFLIILFDGYDTAIYGAVVPVLMEEWALSPVQTGAIGSYTVIGTVVGAVGMSMAADRIGPKKIVISSVVIFSFFTCLSGFANSPLLFAVLRVLAGVGLGGVMPNIVALSTEFSPKKIRSTMVAMIFCGYSVGSMIIALLSKFVIETYGWKPLFWLAAVPLLLVPFMLKALPESLRVLANQGRDREILAIMKKAVPNEKFSEATKFACAGSGMEKASIRKLMSEKRSLSSVMFWVISFSCFLLIYAMNTWLTKLMLQAGYDLSSSLLFLALLNVGATIGTIVIGPLLDKYGAKKVLIPLFFAGALSLIFISVAPHIVIAYILVGIIGAASIGIHNLLNPVVSQYYPPEVRSTALGIMMAFGRLGGIMSPTLVGLLMSQNLSVQANFTVISLACIVGAIAILLVQEKYSYQYTAKDEQKIPLYNKQLG